MTKLKNQIIRSGLKQHWIAQRLKISDSLLSLYASGKRKCPPEKTAQLAVLLNVDIEEIVGYVQQD